LSFLVWMPLLLMLHKLVADRRWLLMMYVPSILGPFLQDPLVGSYLLNGRLGANMSSLCLPVQVAWGLRRG